MGRPSAKFGRRDRLSGKERFRRIFKEGISLRAGCLKLVAMPNGLPYPRFGCAVRREAAPTGVARNRLKRWLREAFRQNRADFPPGLDLVAVVLRAPEKPCLQNMGKEILSLAKGLA